MNDDGNRRFCNEQNDGGTCVNIEFSSSIYNENKYKCLCQDKFKGLKCNEGKKNKYNSRFTKLNNFYAWALLYHTHI